jgi:GTP-binding protein EngB required for normal cell division
MYHSYQDFDQHIQDLRSLQQEVASLWDVNHDDAEQPLRHSWDRIQEKWEHPIFRMMVVGQYKRGKSSFINALLGESVLPVGVLPLTSIITIIRYGEEKDVWVTFINTSEEHIAFDRLSEFVTERENPHNQKQVAYVTISYPSPYLKHHIEIIDSPGIGSVYDHNTDETLHFIDQADAFILITGGDPPIGNEEIRFLNTVREQKGKIFVLVNKIDQFSFREEESILSFTRQMIENKVGLLGVEIYALSAKQALYGRMENDYGALEKSRMQNFEERLERFFLYESGKYFIEKLVALLQQFVMQWEVYLQLRDQMMRGAQTEWKAKMEAFQQAMNTIAEEQSKDIFLLKKTFHLTVERRLDQDIEHIKQTDLPALQKRLEKFFFDHAALSTRRMMEYGEQFIQDSILSVMKNMRRQEEKKMIDLWNTIDRDLLGVAYHTMDMLVQQAKEILGMDISSFSYEHMIPPSQHFRFIFTDPEVELVLLERWMLQHIPRAWINGYLHHRLQDQLEQLFDRQCGRIRYDFLSRMQERFNQILHDMEISFDTFRTYFEQQASFFETQGTKLFSDQQDVQQSMHKKKKTISNIKAKIDDLQQAIATWKDPVGI